MEGSAEKPGGRDGAAGAGRGAPPTERPVARARRVRAEWPVPVGVIAVVVAILGMLSGAWKLAGSLWVAPALRVTPAPAGAMDIAKMQEEVRPALFTEVGTVAVLGVVLIACGVGLMKRRAWGATLALVWGVVRAVSGVVITVWMMMVQRESFAHIPVTPGGPPPGLVSGMAMAGGLVAGIAASCALPIVAIVWFLRPRVRAEVASWRGRPAPGA